MDNEHKKEETIFDKHKENIYFRWGLTAITVIVVCILFAQVVTKLPAFLDFLKRFFGALAPVLYGLVIAYLLHPIVDRVVIFLKPRLEKKMKPERAESLSKGAGIIIALILAAVVVYALLAMILPQLVDSIVTIVGNLDMYYSTLSGWVMRFIDDTPALANITEDLMQKFYDYLTGFLTQTLLPRLETLLATVTTSVVGLAKGLLNLVIGVIVSVYLLSGKEKFLAQGKKLLYACLGRKKSGMVLNVCAFANRTFGGFIGGKILDSAIIGVLCFIGLTALKMPYALLISIFVGVTNVIPFFGPFIGAIPSALLLLVISPIHCLTFVIFVFVLQQLDGNVIGPLILGDATGLSSIWVIVAILVFGNIWGIVGMIIGVPTFAVLFKIVTVLVNRKLTLRGLSTNTEDYKDWHYPPRKDYREWSGSNRKKKLRFSVRKAAAQENSQSEAAKTTEE